MMIIHKKPNSGNIVWDNDKMRPLLRFNDGRFETDNEYIAKKAQSLGYEVEGLTKEKGLSESSGKTKGVKKTVKVGE